MRWSLGLTFTLGGLFLVVGLGAAQNLPIGLPVELPLDLPVNPSTDPAQLTQWVGQHQGVLYTVKDGVVQRLDGAPVDPQVAQQILKVQRVSEVLDAHPELLQHLKERSLNPTAVQSPLAQAEAAAAKLRNAAHLLAGSPLNPVLQQAGAPDAASLLAKANTLDQEILKLRMQLEQVRSASSDTRDKVKAFEKSHSVESMRQLTDSFGQTIPVYEKAIRQAEVARAQAEQASQEAEAALAQAEKKAVPPASGGSSPIPTQLQQAKSDLGSAASEFQDSADDLESDSDAMKGIVSQSNTQKALPISWILGGIGGLATLGVGSILWARRRTLFV